MSKTITLPDGRQVRKKRSKEQALAAIKERTLEIFAKQERYHLVSDPNEEGLLVLEEGRGVLELWNWRKVEWLQRLVKQKEIDEAREKHEATKLERSLQYLGTFQQGTRVKFDGAEGWNECYFERFVADYNVKAKISIKRKRFEKDEEGKRVPTEWTETATVWTEDLKLWK